MPKQQHLWGPISALTSLIAKPCSVALGPAKFSPWQFDSRLDDK